MAAMKPRTGDGPLEVTKEGRGIVMRVPLEGGGRLVVEMTPEEAETLSQELKNLGGLGRVWSIRTPPIDLSWRPGVMTDDQLVGVHEPVERIHQHKSPGVPVAGGPRTRYRDLSGP